jgi:hypothetical protein
MKVYFHRACFDGIASAVTATALLERTLGETSFEFLPVDYSIRAEWEAMPLADHSCVVDFLYHPSATYWWDHHATTFVSSKAREDYRKRKSQYVAWDPEAPSCAGFIYRAARGRCPLQRHLEDTIRWADKLDAATYDSPDEAVRQLSPARLIALSFVVEDTPIYYDFLIRSLLRTTVEEVASTTWCRVLCDEAKRRYELGIELFRRTSSYEAGTVLYDITVRDEIIDRMIPYYLYPQADYSLGIVRTNDRSAKITCNANPWRRPSGPHIGEIFARYGGGGHRDVGSALSRDGGLDPRLAMAEIAHELLRATPDPVTAANY